VARRRTRLRLLCHQPSGDPRHQREGRPVCLRSCHGEA
jgi:hypothetical protein